MKPLHPDIIESRSQSKSAAIVIEYKMKQYSAAAENTSLRLLLIQRRWTTVNSTQSV